MATQNTSGNNTVKYVLIGFGVLSGAAIAGYFIYQHSKQSNIVENSTEDYDDILRSSAEQEEPKYQPSLPPASSTPASTYNSTTSSTFPLKPGSKGPLVVELQKTLIAIHGSQILPKYGADGDWGSETTKALKVKHNLSIVSLPDFTRLKKQAEEKSGGNLITSAIVNPVQTAASAFQATAIASGLMTAIKTKSFTTTITFLRQIKNVQQYVAVNSIFKLMPFSGLTRFTIVNAVLETFKETSERETINKTFLEMGLKNNNGVWSLSGLRYNPNVETLCSTYIWDGKGVEIQVPAGTTLGQLVDTDEGIVRFRTVQGDDLYVLEETVRED